MVKQREGTPIGNEAISFIQNEWNSYNANMESVGRPPKKSSKIPVRTWDVPSLFNTIHQLDVGIEPEGKDPTGMGISEIRRFADEHEITRAVIETCKDQICKLPGKWQLIPRYGQTIEEVRVANESDTRITSLNKFFKRPDKEHTTKQWLRILLEEILVSDTVIIWKQEDILDRVYSLPIIDTALIKRCVSESGQTPSADLEYPDNIAYQQVIKGRVNKEFTTDEMIYYVRNPRAWAFYGSSPVEQIILTLATGMRRMAMQLAHYTDGNVPAMFLRAPKEWSKDQIAEFQLYWNVLMSGDFGELSKGWMIPGDIEPIFPQKETLKDEFDEWIARVVCYAYSVSPNAFIKNLNRATSEQAREQADEEGLQTRKSIVCEIMNLIQEKWWGYEDIEYVLLEPRQEDSLKQTEQDNINIRNGSKSVDEIRRMRGDAPIGAPNRFFTTNGWLAMTEGDIDKMDVFQQRILTDPDKLKESNSSENTIPVSSE
jgi:hypothetical protein